MLFDSDEDEHLTPATVVRPQPKKGPPPRPKFQPPEGFGGASDPTPSPAAAPVPQQQKVTPVAAALAPNTPTVDDDDDGPMFANPVQPLPHMQQQAPQQQQPQQQQQFVQQQPQVMNQQPQQQAIQQQPLQQQPQQQQFVQQQPQQQQFVQQPQQQQQFVQQPQQQFAQQQQQPQQQQQVYQQNDQQQQATFAAQPLSMPSVSSQQSIAPSDSSQQSLPYAQQQQQQQFVGQQQFVQQQQPQQQQQFVQQVPAAPLPPPPPPSAADQWPSNLPALPKAPEQGKISTLAPLPPIPQRVELDPLKQQFNNATNDNVAWESFLQLRKQLEEAHQRTTDLHTHISQTQLSHEKEAGQYREAAQAQINRQAKELQQAAEDNLSAVNKIDTISKLIAKKGEELMKMEQQVHDFSVQNAAMAQKIAHTEDRARVADGGRQVAEVRQRELELTLEHTAELVVNLRKQMQGSHNEKANALQEQYTVFEQNRSDLVAHYQARETEMTEQFNVSVRQAMALMDQHVKEREEKVTKHWKAIVVALEDEYKELKKRNDEQTRRHERDVETHKLEVTQDKEKWIMHLRKEMELLEQRHKEREDHVLADIGRRERELSEREQRSRVTRAQDEQDGKIAIMTKEAELKAYYEKLAEDMRKAHDVDRERMTQSFRDQIQQLQNLHIENERELERMHRDKEREMAQRYRIAGYDVEDTKGDLDRAKASQATQNSLLSKFDSIETKQRERAEQSRAAFKTTSFSNIATTPGAGKK